MIKATILVKRAPGIDGARFVDRDAAVVPLSDEVEVMGDAPAEAIGGARPAATDGLERVVANGATALSEVHDNSAHEDTEGNGSVYLTAPCGTLIELQTLPHGHWYDADSEAHAWTPPRGRA